MKTSPQDIISNENVWQYLANIPDPEIPVLSILDLGIVRDIEVIDNGVTVYITPTYTGCPAMDMIATNIRMELLSKGFAPVKIEHVLSPAWTTDWMTEEGKRKLQEYGIAPPNRTNSENDGPKECPQCHSKNTHILSQFGSTACKALYQCNDCKEAFDYFKCH